MASAIPIDVRRPPAAAPEPEPAPSPAAAAGGPATRVVELILAGVRLRAGRRAAWLRHLWGDEPVTGARAGLDDRDHPQAEARWLAAEAPQWNTRLEQVEAALAGAAGAPLWRLAELFQLSAPEVDLLQTCLAAAVDPDLGAVFAALQHHPGRGWPTEPLAARLFDHGHRRLWSPGSPLSVWRLVTAADAGPGEPVPLACDPQVRDWLHGELGLDGELIGAVAEVGSLDGGREPLPGWPVAATAALIRRAVDGGAGVRVRITGPVGSGRRSFAAAVARQFDIATLAVDADALEEADWVELYVRVQRLAVLAGAALVWHGAALERRWPRQVAPAPIQFMACDPHQEVSPCPLVVEHQLDLPMPTLDERRRLWSVEVPESAAWPRRELDGLVARHRLTVGDIVAAGRRRPASAAEAATICRELTRHRLGDLGQLLDCPFGWEDLVIPDALRQALEDFTFEARDRAAFWETTAARRLFPRGTGLVGLLGGPPGTGKTMAAQVVAADLELDLFRIDLATVVSKYIGETSKNLRQIFSRAAHMNAVMLFDEADALFSKRTEVKDAHDRYANTDTNYLLQLLEDYRGVALLATNKKGNVDPAFIRRIRYVFDFRRPDAGQRQLLWRQILGEIGGGDAAERLAAEIEALARGVEMTGAQIKNAALAAVFAARQRRRELAAADVLRGVERELGKDGRALPRRVQERLVGDG